MVIPLCDLSPLGHTIHPKILSINQLSDLDVIDSFVRRSLLDCHRSCFLIHGNTGDGVEWSRIFGPTGKMVRVIPAQVAGPHHSRLIVAHVDLDGLPRATAFRPGHHLGQPRRDLRRGFQPRDSLVHAVHHHLVREDDDLAVDGGKLLLPPG